MKRAIKTHLTDFVAVIGLIAISVGVSYYILQHQRLRIPYLEEKPFILNAEFSTGQAVTAGQGQTIRVAGVRIGDIGQVRLRNGRAIIEMHLDQEFKDLVHTNATALLRPKTGLKDMFIDLDPGSGDAPLAKKGWTIPIASTLPDINPDEVYSALDSDTRDYLRLLVHGAGRGLEGRGGDLREVFRRFEPTHRDLARVNSAVAERRRNLRRLMHNLQVLSTELASGDDQLAGLVTSVAQVMRAFASEEQRLSEGVAELPTALQETTDALGRVERFATLLGPTAAKLRPAARKLEAANDAVTPFAKEIAPVLADDIRPFVKQSRPLVRALNPGADRLADAAGDLAQVGLRLNNFFNLLAFNPGGREGPEKADRHEGYLFWVAWASHMGLNLFSSADAHGVFRPVTLAAPCATIKQIVQGRPELAALLGFVELLEGTEACNTQTMQASEKAAREGRPLAPAGSDDFKRTLTGPAKVGGK